jgi:AbrB family looped-hinge helix DNA binding protein
MRKAPAKKMNTNRKPSSSANETALPNQRANGERESAFHTMTSKGQVTIPLHVRQALGLQPGDKVGFIKQGDNFIVTTPRAIVEETAGVFKKYAEVLDRAYSAEELRDFYEVGVADEVVKSMRESE